MRRRRAESIAVALLIAAAAFAGSAQETGTPPAEVAPAPEAPATAAPTAAPESPSTAAPAESTPQPAASAADFRSKVYEYRSLGDSLRRPTGEVTVTADRAEWQQAGVMKYTGNVTLSVDTLQLRGESLELKQFEAGSYEAHLTGEPARLSDSGVDGAPPINAYAKRLHYDARTSLAELSGNAVLTRGMDRLTGENIRYDTAARRVQAAGGNSGQVRIVIQPPAPKSTKP
jgi:lipopolysaccharide export system protein LptA